MSMTLKRVAILPQGAFGVLLWHGLPFAVSVERTYPDGGVQRVKIPPGSYRCVRSWYQRGEYDTWQVIVPGHTDIKFHRGNVEADVDGCIAIARQFGILNGATAVLSSAVAHTELMALTSDVDEFELTVANT